MTNQEIKEKLMDMLTEGVTLSISNTEERIKITAGTSDGTTFMKQKVTLDKMSAFATANGYKISLDDIDVSRAEGRTTYFQAVFLKLVPQGENK